jgi:hypothetical protein
MNKSSLLITTILDERITYGRALYTRRELLREMQVAGHNPRAIDFFVFRGEALNDSAIADLIARGELHNAVADVFPEWYEQFRSEQ